MPDQPLLPDLTVVVPLHNEEGNLCPLVAEIHQALAPTGRLYEIILVDDGSSDRTAERLDRLEETDTTVRALHLERNFGQAAALTAGFEAARGAIILSLDGDLQNDPADLPRLVDLLEEGSYRVVSGWRKRRSEAKCTALGWLTRVLPSLTANALIALLTGLPSKDNGCSLKAYRSEVVKGTYLPPGMHRFLPAVFGVRREEFAQVEVAHRPRRTGESHYGLGRFWAVVRDLLTLPFILRGNLRRALLCTHLLLGSALVLGSGAGMSLGSHPVVACVLLGVSALVAAYAMCVRTGLWRWVTAQRSGVFRLRTGGPTQPPAQGRRTLPARAFPRGRVKV